MKTYVGTKVLLAVAMTLGAYNEKRGWTIPENEYPNTEGYFVQYSDDYVSWSPKEVFEESYIELKLSNIEKTSELPHQQRVIEEAKELADKAEKLSYFIELNPIFDKLPKEEQCRLKLQLVTMKGYYSVLSERIDNF